MAKQIKKAAIVASFEEACKAQGLDPLTVIPDVSCMPEKDRAALVALAKMCIIQRSLNGEWVPDWNNSNQYKYYPWFDVEQKEEGPSGFALSFNGYDCTLSYAGLGARLFYKDAKTAQYAGETFTALYEDMVLIPR